MLVITRGYDCQWPDLFHAFTYLNQWDQRRMPLEMDLWGCFQLRLGFRNKKHTVCLNESAIQHVSFTKDLADFSDNRPGTSCSHTVFQVSESSKLQAGWWFGTFFIFPYIENSHPPNWRTLIFFRGVWGNHQPDWLGPQMDDSVRQHGTIPDLPSGW